MYAQNPSAQDKARMKTAATVAGVQEDLNNLRTRLTAPQQVSLYLCS